MKKIISLSAAAVMMFSLAGCNDDSTAEGAADWRLVTVGDTIEREKNGMFITDTNNALSFLDFSTMEQAPVCDDPTCKHEVGSCNSYGKNNLPFLYDDKLHYFKVTDYYQEGEEFYVDTQLWQSDINGANEKQVAEFKGFDFSVGEWMLLYGDTIYMCMTKQPYDKDFNELEASAEFVSYNLERGETTNYGEIAKSYNSGGLVLGLWDEKVLFQITTPSVNMPFMERLAKYAEENNLTEDEAFATYDGDLIFKYYQFDIASGEISECEYPDPLRISHNYYYYLDGDRLMYLDSEGEEHEIEELRGEIANAFVFDGYAAFIHEDVTYLFDESEQELTKLNDLYLISAIYDDSAIISTVTDGYSLAYDKKPISELEA